MTRNLLFLILVSLLVLPPTAAAQGGADPKAAPVGTEEASVSPAGPAAPADVKLTTPPAELAKLGRWLGEWKMTYTMSSELTDGKGGAGSGTMSVKKVMGGYALMAESSSKGSLGDQEDISIWTWDPSAKEFKSHQFNQATCFRPTTVSMTVEGDTLTILGIIPTKKGEVQMLEKDTFAGNDKIQVVVQMKAGEKLIPMIQATYLRVR